MTCCLTRRGDRYKWAFNLAKVGPQPGEAVLPIASAPESSDFLFREVKRKARERLEAASDRLARELLKMATDPNVSESVRLSATKDALDRGGVSAKTAVEVEVGPPKPYEQILDSLAVVESGSRAEFRRSRGITGNEDPPVERSGDDPGSPPEPARVRSQCALPPGGFDR